MDYYEDACQEYRKALEMDPRHATALALMGKTLMFMDDYDGAITKFHEVSCFYPLDLFLYTCILLAQTPN